jgi:hypothetical protein
MDDEFKTGFFVNSWVVSENFSYQLDLTHIGLLEIIEQGKVFFKAAFVLCAI